MTRVLSDQMIFTKVDPPVWAQDWVTCRATRPDRRFDDFPETRREGASREWVEIPEGPAGDSRNLPARRGHLGGQGPPRGCRWGRPSPRRCAPLWVGSRWEDPAFRPSTARGQRDCPLLHWPVNLSSLASDKYLSPQTFMVTNTNKSQSLLLSASAGGRALMALPPRTPGKHLGAPGPPRGLHLLSAWGPLDAVAAQHAGTVCRPDLPSGVLRLKSQDKVPHLLWPPSRNFTSSALCAALSPPGSCLLPTFPPASHAALSLRNSNYLPYPTSSLWANQSRPYPHPPRSLKLWSLNLRAGLPRARYSPLGSRRVPAQNTCWRQSNCACNRHPAGVKPTLRVQGHFAPHLLPHQRVA